MKMRMILFVALMAAYAHSLTLEEVRLALAENSIPQDSVEMNLRITVKAAGISRQTEVYIASKGPGKSYTEIRSDFLKQRSVVNGNKMKVVDLKTKRSQVLDYNGEALSDSYAQLHPLDSGDWGEPKFLSGNLYVIDGSLGTLYYDCRKKRIEKIEAVKGRANSLTTFSYGANGQLKKMEVSVSADGVESLVSTEILRMRKSDKLPDSLFDF